MNPTNVEAEREAPMTTFASGAGCFHHPFSNPERAKRLIFVAFAETFPDLSCSAHGAFLVYDSPKRMGKCGSWMSKQLFKKEQSSTQFHTKTRIRKISTFSGWWLYTHPVLKNDGVRQLGWLEIPNIHGTIQKIDGIFITWGIPNSWIVFFIRETPNKTWQPLTTNQLGWFNDAWHLLDTGCAASAL